MSLKRGTYAVCPSCGVWRYHWRMVTPDCKCGRRWDQTDLDIATQLGRLRSETEPSACSRTDRPATVKWSRATKEVEDLIAQLRQKESQGFVIEGLQQLALRPTPKQAMQDVQKRFNSAL